MDFRSCFVPLSNPCRFGAWFVLATSLSGCGIAFPGPLHWLAGHNFHVIESGRAYRSRQPDPEFLRSIVPAYGIRTVINLRGENADEAWYQAEARTLDELGVAMVDVRMSAKRPPHPDTLLALFEAVQSAEHPILMHCQGGADRTGAAAAIWRMTVLGHPREEALEELAPSFGHYRQVTPAMDWLAEQFVPSREWITTTYDPNAFYETEEGLRSNKASDAAPVRSAPLALSGFGCEEYNAFHDPARNIRQVQASVQTEGLCARVSDAM